MDSLEVGRILKDDVPSGTMRRLGRFPDRVLVANVGGFFYALNDACPHGGFSLSEGVLDGPWVTCPGHGWVINVRHGGRRSAGGSFVPCARRYPVRSDGDWLVVMRPPG